MLRVELLLGAAIALTIIWLLTFVYAITVGGVPPMGIIVTLVTAAACGMWALVWGTYLRIQLKELREQLEQLQEERDVNDAVQRLQPHLRIINRNH